MKQHDDDLSCSIAGLAGPVLIAMSAFLLLHRKSLPEMSVGVSSDWMIIVLSGLILLVAGVAIVRAHNIWETSWRLIVTLIGWLSIVGGTARILYPRQLARLAESVLASPPNVVIPAVAMLALGTFLTLKGFRLV